MTSQSTGCTERKVFISFDASKESLNALHNYLDYIHHDNYCVVLLHIIELPDLAHARQMNYSPSALNDMWMKEGQKAEVLKAQYEKILTAKGVKHFESRCERGVKPGEVITQLAAKENALMIVLGTRGMGLVRRTILGSVSDYVIHHAACPVVICRLPSNNKAT